MGNPQLINGVASPQHNMQTSLIQYHRLGTRGVLDDRSYRYARLTNATGVVANNLCQSAIPEPLHVSETGASTFVIGSTRVTLVLGAAAAAANRYEDGYVKIQNSTTGLGQMFKLKAHEAVASAGTGTFELYDPILITPSGTVTWSLIENLWGNIIITPVTTITAPIVGVPNVVIPGATAVAPVFCWLQTWGLCSVLADASAMVTNAAVIPSATVGAVGVALETDIKQRIGIAAETLTASAQYITVDLKIAP